MRLIRAKYEKAKRNQREKKLAFETIYECFNVVNQESQDF